MIRLYADDKALWLPHDSNKLILNPSVNLAVNTVGSASFKILPGHSLYDSLEKMRTVITVKQDSDIIFKGRVYSDNKDFKRIKTIEVEGLLGYFNDSRVRPYSYTGSVIGYVEKLITQHNNQVEPAQRFKMGRVTVTDPNDYIIRESSDTPTTWSEITAKLIELLGGYIVIRYENDGNYIDYLADYETTANQEIRYAVNLLDLTLEGKGDTLSTCIIPYGAVDDKTQVKIDITSVNNGVDYVYNADAVAKYGKIYEVKEWEDVTLPKNLLTKAKAYLETKINIATRLDIKAIDLHLSDDQLEGFRLGDYIRVYSKPHDIDEVMLLTVYNMDLSDPANSTITLGEERNSFTKIKTSRAEAMYNVGAIGESTIDQICI